MKCLVLCRSSWTEFAVAFVVVVVVRIVAQLASSAGKITEICIVRFGMIA